MAIAIKADGLSKAYQLGEFSTGTLSQDIERIWYRMRGKEDPYLKIGETNDRTAKGESNIVWSLKDINFEIQQGDAVGIIGRNGAGKSTLLKVLSRVTTPTTGSIRLRGRIASLLEVGTGFHPELTGRENIFLNGAILGMRKYEVKRKFDEIVNFAGVERYIDTPVKRYSSGMYVRLAFAVAAHLDSEILIVDEVLAVGDAEFQKKCLAKMNEVSKGQGRTILFVSHTMPAVKQLCNKAVLLNQGRVELDGSTAEVINHYLSGKSTAPSGSVQFDLEQDSDLYFTSVVMLNDKGGDVDVVTNEDCFYIETSFVLNRDIENVEISICFKNSDSVNVFFTSLSDAFGGNIYNFKAGSYTARVKIRSNFLLPDSYSIDLYAHHRNQSNINSHSDVIKFSIVDVGSYMAPYGKAANDFTCILERCEWQLGTTN